MKYSNFFLPTIKDAPSDAEIISHKLMIRAGIGVGKDMIP